MGKPGDRPGPFLSNRALPILLVITYFSSGIILASVLSCLHLGFFIDQLKTKMQLERK